MHLMYKSLGASEIIESAVGKSSGDIPLIIAPTAIWAPLRVVSVKWNGLPLWYISNLTPSKSGSVGVQQRSQLTPLFLERPAGNVAA